MIISGGFNVYPSDLEAVLSRHEAVQECAVVGVPSRQWGETPVGFVVLRPGRSEPAAQLKDWANAQLDRQSPQARAAGSLRADDRGYSSSSSRSVRMAR
jgi:acyl-CoA synthetase (AMP-forming)/AMP-acid ligase II